MAWQGENIALDNCCRGELWFLVNEPLQAQRTQRGGYLLSVVNLSVMGGGFFTICWFCPVVLLHHFRLVSPLHINL